MPSTPNDEPRQLELLDYAGQREEELALDDDQIDAAYLLTAARVAIVTGGPGRGKTRTLQAALRTMGRSVALCAPSGKAARRMAELTRHPASTVHRLLGLRPNSSQSTYSRANPLPYDAVVVDEASTLDVYLFAQLLEACDVERTRVILIGDVDQLPSVGPGNVLHDLVQNGAVPVVRLKTMHRAALDSWVCRMAPEILEGRIELDAARDFWFIEASDNIVSEVVRTAVQLVKMYGAEAVQVMAPMNVGRYGTQAMNVELQKALNPGDGPSFAAGGARIRARDAVVVVSNDYDRATFNGECGQVVHIGTGDDDRVLVDLGDREVEYTRRDAAEALRLAYALSVHKMQGSEVPWAVVALHESYGPLLTRRSLYTAVTRAKEGVVLIGQESAIQRALQVVDASVRKTTLGERLPSQVG